MRPYRAPVYVCTGKGCRDSRPEEIVIRLREELEKRGLRRQVLVTRLGCTMQHRHGSAAVTIYLEGVCYAGVSPEDVGEIVEEHLVKGRIVDRLLHYTVNYSTLTDGACR